MSIGLRVLLIVVSMCNLFYVLRKIRQSKLQIEYSLFWIGFSALLLVMSLFPKVMFWLTELIGIQSPVNLVFLIIIFILIVRNFSLSIHVSQLEHKVNDLVQNIALGYEKKSMDKEGK